jgi:hypothetical protein
MFDPRSGVNRLANNREGQPVCDADVAEHDTAGRKSDTRVHCVIGGDGFVDVMEAPPGPIRRRNGPLDRF